MLGESTLLPIPSEVVLPFVGFLMWSHLMNPIGGFLVAVAGAVIGSIMMFAAGKYLSKKLLKKYGRKSKILSIKSYSRGVRWFGLYGAYFAFVTKLLPAIRSIASAFCGAYKMNFLKFLIYTTAGILIWSAVLVSIGYYVSGEWFILSNALQNAMLYPLALFIIIVLIAIFYRRLKKIWDKAFNF
jgi:membrane protein DedA with SNARE-associated domain